MLEVKILKDSGVGKEALIIGGGNSVKAFDFSIYNHCVTFVINDTVHLPKDLKIDFNIYRDVSYQNRLIERLRKHEFDRNIKVIMHTNCNGYADYYYCANQLGADLKHTGADCLFICDHIMNFDQIYLIGFDYYELEGKIHYYSKGTPESDFYANEMNSRMYRRAFLKNAIKDFDKVEWSNRIINLNPESQLQIFKRRCA